MSDLLRQIALVSDTPLVPFADVARVGAALQKQAARDFGPAWGLACTVDAFAYVEDVPHGYWPIVVREDTGDPALPGYHLTWDGQPFAVVAARPDWPVTASHECLEVLADPFGSRLVPGYSVDPARSGDRVEYLVETCDPCQAVTYKVNEVDVSDFCTPAYFNPVGPAGMAYSYTGAVTAPRQVLPGGYLSFKDVATGHWLQAWNVGGQLQFVDRGPLPDGVLGLRVWVDRWPVPPAPAWAAARAGAADGRTVRLPPPSAGLGRRAADLRQQIAALATPPRPPPGGRPAAAASL